MTPEEKKEKAKFARIKAVYGLSREDYDNLNKGSCPICLRVFDSTVTPVVDHDHVSRLVRGIVCRYCNHRRIGHHRDSALLRRIASYLDNSPVDLVMPPKKKKKRKKKI